MLHNSDLFEQLKNGDTVVVPDAAYAANLRQQYSNWTACSVPVWQTPAIFAWQEWLKLLWLQQQRLSGDCAIVLNVMQQRLLWQRVIKSDISGHTRTVLWNLNASISQARNAWALLYDYDLDLSDHSHLANDVRVFIRWKQEYLKRLRDNEWLDPRQLAGLLIESDLKLVQQGIEFFGFADLTPAQNNFFESVFSLPVSIYRSGDDNIDRHNLTVFEYSDIDEELRACANWAREKYQTDPSLRIGVLVADLSNIANKVEFIFKSIFVPDYALDVNQCDVFSISQKNTLIEKGLINSGLNCLDILAPHFDYEQFSRFLTDSYIGRDEKLKHDLCLADVQLRRIVNADVSLSFLIDNLNRIQADGELDVANLSAQLQALNTYVKTFEKSATIINWCDRFAAVLKILKWPDIGSLCTADKQLFKHWDQLFASVCTAGLVYQQLSLQEALNLFKDAAAMSSFKSRQARISIVDINESQGMSFDASWVCGLSDAVLPSPVKFNPLLPFRLQRQYTLPFSSSADCHSRAKTQFEQLFSSAQPQKFSFYKNDEQLNRRVSPLLTGYDVVTVPLLSVTELNAACRIELETYFDDVGLVLDDNRAAGGSYLLKSQAQCPFKGYAEKRLSVEPIDKRDLGLDPAERGNLVHQLLHNLWRKLKNRSALKALTDNALDAMIHQQVDKVINTLGGAHKLFIEVEAKRLRHLALKWLRLEMSRDNDFSVSFLELPLTYSRLGLEFKFKIDRVDLLEDGSLLVIDYKTGNASKSSWLDQRVQDPQMPVYYFALSQTQSNTVTALAFANTKSLAFDGLCEDDVSIMGITQVENNNRGKLKNFEDWGPLVAHWDKNIETLVKEIKTGFASVTPDSLNNCKFCGRQSLCRINQHQSFARDDQA